MVGLVGTGSMAVAAAPVGPGEAAARPAAALAMAAPMAVAVSTATTASATGEVPIGQLLRDAPLQPLNGPPRTLAEYRGRALLINVWASWCAPCRQEMASLERLAWHDAARGFDILGISTDDDADAARAWLRATNATLSHFIDSRLQLETLLGASRLPLTVLVGADGRVLARHYGARDWDSAESLALIAATFARARAAGERDAPRTPVAPGAPRAPGAAASAPTRAAPR